MFPLPSAVTQVVGSAPSTPPRVAVAMQQGGVMFWGEHANAGRSAFASEMIEPRIALTRRGCLVAASKDEIDVYRTAEGQLQLSARLPGNQSPPLAATLTSNADQFAIIYPDGRVAIYRIDSH
jgi:hypothetical protein